MRISPEIRATLRPGVIAPRFAIVAGLIVCVVSLYFLTPSRTALFKRLMADGDKRAAALLVAEGEGGDTSDLVAETIRICQSEGWDHSSLGMLLSFIRENDDPDAAREEALRHIDHIPGEPRTAVLGALARRALSDDDPRTAQKLQILLIESADRLTPEIVSDAVVTYRYNGDAAQALMTINTLEKQRGSLPADLRELQLVLLGETDQMEVAFVALRKRVRATDDPTLLRTLIPEAVKSGIAVGRLHDLIPLYEKYLAVVSSGPDSADPLVREYSMKLGQTYEWTKQPSKAFDIFVELAALGHRQALDRCLALNPGLFRQQEVMNALVSGFEHYRDDDELVLLTARLHAESALRDQAIKFYSEYLERNPEDPEAHYRLGAVYDEAVQLEMAYEHYQRAYQLAPDGNTYLAKVGRMATTLRRYDEALSYLRILSSRTRERDHIEQYHTLADGLGDTAAMKESLRLLIESGGRQSATNYIYLASVYRDEGDLAGHLEVLKEALGKHPDNPFIRIELANAHLFERRPDRSLEVLRDLDLRRYPQAAQAAVNALTTLDNLKLGVSPARYLKRFGSQLEASDALSAGEVLQFAELCKKHGNSERGSRLFRRVLEEANDPEHLARANYHLGRYREARGHQIEFLRNAAAPASSDYHMLGDIHTKLQESRSARKAYEKALSLLQKRTANLPTR